MRIHFGCDHAGFDLKEDLIRRLGAAGHDCVDHGATGYDAEDDYPAFCIAAAEAVAGEPGSVGVVIGGSGNGEQIAANKVMGIRAALVWSEQIAGLAREHNNANVMSIGARMHDPDTALHLVETFLATPFTGAERHQRRIRQVEEYEHR
jgi:ribose 5-phosphate isomerase B